MNITGVLIAIGGNEDKGKKIAPLHVQDSEVRFATSGVLYRILSELNSDYSSLEVITSASSIPEQVGKNYIAAFKKLGHKNTHVLNISTREEADKPEVLDRISKAGCIMFSGGDQFKLTSVMKNTQLSRIINERYITDELVVAGTSAGSMAMPDIMIYPGSGPVNVTTREVAVYEGLSLIHDIIIDTHFLVRGRFRRLAVACANNPDHIGIGLEEDTGVIISQGNKIEAIGSGLVTILDAREIQKKNPSVKKAEHEIFIENLLVHVLSNGDHFTLKKKKIA